MFKDKTIFFAALDWGLGHATRSLPIVSELAKANTVILGVSPAQKIFYEFHFPHLQQVPLPSYNVSYSLFFPAWLKILLRSPSLFSIIRKEHSIVEKLISSVKIDVLLSDNRYGLYSEKKTSVIICHQLTVRAPFFGSWVNKIHRKLLSRFNEIWVPDYESGEISLAGELSRNTGDLGAVKYIGPPSALVCFEEPATEKIDYLLLLSGPEPSRSEFEKRLLKAFENSRKKIVLVRGSTISAKSKNNHIQSFDLLWGESLAKLILAADVIICRSGYSTLMDLHRLNKKKLILVATPGQTEQEYLARYWEKKFGALNLKQKKVAAFEF